MVIDMVIDVELLVRGEWGSMAHRDVWHTGFTTNVFKFRNKSITRKSLFSMSSRRTRFLGSVQSFVFS